MLNGSRAPEYTLVDDILLAISVFSGSGGREPSIDPLSVPDLYRGCTIAEPDVNSFCLAFFR
jgi:hypothetical protein